MQNMLGMLVGGVSTGYIRLTPGALHGLLVSAVPCSVSLSVPINTMHSECELGYSLFEGLPTSAEYALIRHRVNIMTIFYTN